LGGRNLSPVPCLDCHGMTDPFGGLTVKNGQIIITEYFAGNCKGIFEYSFQMFKSSESWDSDKVIEESSSFDYQDHSPGTLCRFKSVQGMVLVYKRVLFFF
jgi:hypothetical protein